MHGLQKVDSGQCACCSTHQHHTTCSQGCQGRPAKQSLFRRLPTQHAHCGLPGRLCLKATLQCHPAGCGCGTCRGPRLCTAQYTALCERPRHPPPTHADTPPHTHTWATARCSSASTTLLKPWVNSTQPGRMNLAPSSAMVARALVEVSANRLPRCDNDNSSRTNSQGSTTAMTTAAVAVTSSSSSRQAPTHVPVQQLQRIYTQQNSRRKQTRTAGSMYNIVSSCYW
jgi:hypothetical protein